jgi:hypothetical protein
MWGVWTLIAVRGHFFPRIADEKRTNEREQSAA